MTGLEFLEKQDAVEAYIGNSFFNAFAGGLTSKGGGVGVGGVGEGVIIACIFLFTGNWGVL